MLPGPDTKARFVWGRRRNGLACRSLDHLVCYVYAQSTARGHSACAAYCARACSQGTAVMRPRGRVHVRPLGLRLAPATGPLGWPWPHRPGSRGAPLGVSRITRSGLRAGAPARGNMYMRMRLEGELSLAEVALWGHAREGVAAPYMKGPRAVVTLIGNAQCELPLVVVTGLWRGGLGGGIDSRWPQRATSASENAQCRPM